MSISVVIVDDDKDTVAVFAEYMKLKGFNVLATGNDGKEAVELYEKHRPDVILSDLMMPVYDGFYGIKNIQKNHPDAKIILVTADLSDETLEKINSCGISGLIYKPYEIENVVKTVNQVVNGEKTELPSMTKS
ncbi:MAG: response regulator transcription factor [Nitrosopumilaceae archaeon]|nr:response regulator transcription factor [Nitrosopumilaceae archaeon]